MNSNLILIFLCLILGMLLRQSQKLPQTTPAVLNALIIWVCLPAVVLIQIPPLFQSQAWNPEFLIPILTPWIGFLLACVLFYPLGRALQWKSTEIGALILTAGLGNTSFVGFPLLEWLMGPESIRIGILVDQIGSFLVVSILGITVALAFSPQEGRSNQLSTIIKKVLYFPPFVSMLAAALIGIQGGYGQGPWLSVLEKLAAPLVPLALISVGFQLQFSKKMIRQKWKIVSLGLGFKLILTPAIIALLFVALMGSQTFITQVSILESAMAPMITAAIIAEEFGLDADIANLMVGVGIPVSIGTVYLWYLWLV